MLQAAKTYMERSFETFSGASLDELVKHALHALQASLQVCSRHGLLRHMFASLCNEVGLPSRARPVGECCWRALSG